MRERLDMLQRLGESSGRRTDEVVATTRSDEEEKESGERGGRMGGLGFVRCVGEGFIHLGVPVDDRHGDRRGHGGRGCTPRMGTASSLYRGGGKGRGGLGPAL